MLTAVVAFIWCQAVAADLRGCEAVLPNPVSTTFPLGKFRDDEADEHGDGMAHLASLFFVLADHSSLQRERSSFVAPKISTPSTSRACVCLWLLGKAEVHGALVAGSVTQCFVMDASKRPFVTVLDSM